MEFAKVDDTTGVLTFNRWPGIEISPSDIATAASKFGLREPSSADIKLGRKIAAEKIHPGVAHAEEYERVANHSEICSLVYREGSDVTGMMAMLLLNAAGHMALRDGSFDAQHPSLSHLAEPGDLVSAGYGWGFVALTKEAGRAVVGATDGLRQQFFRPIDVYTRAATPDGVRVLEGLLGYRAVPWTEQTGLIWIPAEKKA